MANPGELSASTIRSIRDHLYLVDDDFRHSDEVNRHFLALLGQGQGVYTQLQRMNRYGLLAAYLPAFGNIVGRMQYDLFHVYTVDQHTLFVVRNLRRFAEQQQQSEKTLEIPGTVAWDRSGKFKSEVTVELEGDRLHLVYRVQDASPWVNNGRDWTTLFATGDTVDLQIGVDSSADPGRRKPVEGDQRLLIAPFEGESIAVLYQHRKPKGKDLNPIEFTSPWRGETVDNVVRLTDAEITVERRNNAYTVDVRVPRKTLGLEATNATLKADFGVTFGDAEGTETQLRSYWTNPATMLVDDIPGEIMLHPNLWGTLRIP